MSAGRTVNTLSLDWGTPHKYVNAVKEFFDGDIDLDPCSNEYSVVNALNEYRLPKHDGLRESWKFRRIYVNPPYGTDKVRGTRIKNWFYRCVEANRNYDSEVLALVPVATNTGHWKNYVFGHATAVSFLYDTRLKFLVGGKDEGKGAPMSCSMVYWGKDYEKFYNVFIKFGAVIDLRPLKEKKIGKNNKMTQSLLLDEFYSK